MEDQNLVLLILLYLIFSNDLGLTDLQHRASNLIYCGDGHCVDTVFVDGKLRVKDKKLIDFDEVAFVNKCNELITKLNEEVDKV